MFASGTSQGGVRTTTRTPVGLEGDGPGDPPTVSSGSHSEVEGSPAVPSVGCSETGGALGDPPGSRSGAAGGGDGADKVSSVGAACATSGPSASTTASARTTSWLLGRATTSLAAAGMLRRDSNQDHKLQRTTKEG